MGQKMSNPTLIVYFLKTSGEARFHSEGGVDENLFRPFWPFLLLFFFFSQNRAREGRGCSPIPGPSPGFFAVNNHPTGAWKLVKKKNPRPTPSLPLVLGSYSSVAKLKTLTFLYTELDQTSNSV